MSANHPRIDFKTIQQELAQATTDKELFTKIVDAPFSYKVETAFLFLGIIVLLLVNKETGTIDRIALSDTELAKNTMDVSVVPFREIKIMVDHPENIIAQAIQSGEPRDTTDWKYLFMPALTPEEARINQASAGIAYSAVYPLKARDGGALIFSYFQYEQQIGKDQTEFMQTYANLITQALKT